MTQDAIQVWKPELISPSDERWGSFISAQPQATIFHHPQWMKLLSECYGYQPFVLAVSSPEDKIGAGVAFMEIGGSKKGRRWVSLPFTDHCAPLFQEETAQNYLVSSLPSLAKEGTIHQIELRWRYPDHPAIQTATNFVLAKVNVDGGPEQVASRIKRKHFRQVNVSKERGVSVEQGIDQRLLWDFYKLHTQTRRQFGVPVQPKKFFEQLWKQLLQNGYGFILAAYKDKHCVAAAIFLNWNFTLIYKYAASNEEGRKSLAMDPILWKAICWGCENGYRWLDMGRTDLSNIGLREFKRRWGAEEIPLSYSYFPAAPMSDRNGRLLSLVKSVIRHSPPWVCRLSGELFYKYFA